MLPENMHNESHSTDTRYWHIMYTQIWAGLLIVNNCLMLLCQQHKSSWKLINHCCLYRHEWIQQ